MEGREKMTWQCRTLRYFVLMEKKDKFGKMRNFKVGADTLKRFCEDCCPNYVYCLHSGEREEAWDSEAEVEKNERA